MDFIEVTDVWGIKTFVNPYSIVAISVPDEKGRSLENKMGKKSYIELKMTDNGLGVSVTENCGQVIEKLKEISQNMIKIERPELGDKIFFDPTKISKLRIYQIDGNTKVNLTITIGSEEFYTCVKQDQLDDLMNEIRKKTESEREVVSL